jgi:hypothetical protein
MKQRSFPNVKGGSMSRIYAIWKAYAMLVIEAVSAYCRKTEDLPVVVSLGLLLVPMFAADWFLPRWASPADGRICRLLPSNHLKGRA